MREFVRRGGLRRLPVETRLVYSGFCLFMLAGYGTGLWFYEADRLGTSGAAAAAYYLGRPESASPEPAGGPQLELPDREEPAAESAALQLEKPLRQVMETLHFHLFSVALCLLVVAHIFMMAGLPRPLKAWTIAVAYGVTLAHLAAPPLVRLGGAGWGWLVFPTALGMAATWLGMTLWPLWEMWRPGIRNNA